MSFWLNVVLMVIYTSVLSANLYLQTNEWHSTLLLISQHWFRYWLAAVRKQAITWNNIDPIPWWHMASLGHNEWFIGNTQDIKLNSSVQNYPNHHCSPSLVHKFLRSPPLPSTPTTTTTTTTTRNIWSKVTLSSTLCFHQVAILDSSASGSKQQEKWSWESL